MTDKQDYFQANKELWNQRTTVHLDSAFYNLEGFKKGETVLTPIELSELGVVKGKNLLHLQCHFGMDSLDWARRGASVTGVDLSDKAISEAQKLNSEMGLDASFVCCNVLDTSAHVPGQFDIVFTSYGTIGWLPDLDRWADIVSHFLKPGGTFYIADFHPVLWMMDEDFEKIKYDYFNTTVITEEISGSYSDRNAPIRSTEHSWNHPLTEIFTALISHGMQLMQFNEFPYSTYNCFNKLEQGGDGMWRIKGMNEKMPMMYSIKAIKQG